MCLLQFTSLASLCFPWLSSYLNECGLGTLCCPMPVTVMVNYTGCWYGPSDSLWQPSWGTICQRLCWCVSGKGLALDRAVASLSLSPQHKCLGAPELAVQTVAVPAPACFWGCLHCWSKHLFIAFLVRIFNFLGKVLFYKVLWMVNSLL